MQSVPDNELKSSLINANKILEENELIKQSWLDGISQQKMVIVPISTFRTLHDIAQIEAYNRSKWSMQ
jgi:hypothetical protein